MTGQATTVRGQARVMRRARRGLLVVVYAGLAVLCAKARAGSITYDAQENLIRVQGHPENAPATLAQLKQANDAGGWNTVRYDRDKNAYTVTARLRIGTDDGAESWLRVGASQDRCETLRMRADLVVAAAKEGKYYRSYEGENGLLLRAPASAASRPALRFDCLEQGACGLVLEAGGALVAVDADIGAVSTQRGNRASWNGTGNRLRLERCTVEGFERLYHLATADAAQSVVRGTTFRHIGTVFVNGPQYAEDCVFRDVDLAVGDGGGMRATLVRCRFRDNKRNWMLRYTKGGIRAIDCVFGPPEEQQVICRGAVRPDTGERSYPLFIAQQHLMFAVRDEAGAPVPGATVTLTCEQDAPGAVVLGRARTDEHGCTPGVHSHRALFVTNEYYLATDDPENPEHRQYTYKATVSAPGFADATVEGLDPDVYLGLHAEVIPAPDWLNLVRVTLKRAEP